MSLFVLASKDGWVNIMYHGLDAVGIDQQVKNNITVNTYAHACGYSKRKVYTLLTPNDDQLDVFDLQRLAAT